MVSAVQDQKYTKIHGWHQKNNKNFRTGETLSQAAWGRVARKTDDFALLPLQPSFIENPVPMGNQAKS